MCVCAAISSIKTPTIWKISCKSIQEVFHAFELRRYFRIMSGETGKCLRHKCIYVTANAETFTKSIASKPWFGCVRHWTWMSPIIILSHAAFAWITCLKAHDNLRLTTKQAHGHARSPTCSSHIPSQIAEAISHFCDARAYIQSMPSLWHSSLHFQPAFFFFFFFLQF